MLPKAQRKWLILLLLVFSIPLVLNGYPIVHFDSGNYSSSFRNIASFYSVPIDRPIFYGLYVWIASFFGSTLKLIPISQGIILSWLLIKLVDACKGSPCGDFTYYTLIFLVAVSYLPFLVSAVMPDIWTSLMAVACMVLLTRVRCDFKTDAIFYVIISLAIAFAPANALILMLSLIPLAYRLVKKKKLNVVGMLMLSAAFSLALCSLTTFLTFHEFRILKGSQAFIFARLAADNNAQKGIEKLCAESPAAALCRYKDMLIGKDSNEILWYELSEKLDVWKDTSGEIAAVVKTSFERDLIRIILTSIKGSLKTLVLKPHSLQDLYGGPYGSNEFIFKVIQSSYPNDFPSFATSIQQSNPQFYVFQRLFQFYALAFWMQVTLSFTLCLYHIYMRIPLTLSSTFALSFALANAFVCASLSGFDIRYNVKGMALTLLIWTFTLVTEAFELKKSILSKVGFYQCG